MRLEGRLGRPFARIVAVAGAALVMIGGPAVALAHGLSPVYQSPLPLAVYLAGAGTTVALSFVFVLARDMRATTTAPGRVVAVPAVVRHGLQAVGLLGWGWIIAQGIAGGSSDAAVATLFLWVYGWVGVAILSALVFPVWGWLDPFATIHDLGAAVLRRAGTHGWAPSELPRAARVWPAVAGLGFFIWLELVAVPGTAELTLVLAGYTLLTLALMAQYGRDAWRANGETFSVWFGTLNRLPVNGVAPAGGVAAPAYGDMPVNGVAAPWKGGGQANGPATATADPIDRGTVVRRPFASGLLEASWELPRIVLVAIGTGSIIFDGLSQTVAFASVFGVPAVVPKTVILFAFLGVIAVAALLVARTVSPGAIGAGLLPIAVGYLVAHYLTYLLVDGQRIVIAISDPLQQGSDLFGTAFFQPDAGWLPPGLVWTAQLASVVGGHMLGAWAGHVRAQRDAEAAKTARQARDMRHRKIAAPAIPIRRNVRQREIPLAVVMVFLTTLTLWSLGQAIVVEPAPEGTVRWVAVPG